MHNLEKVVPEVRAGAFRDKMSQLNVQPSRGNIADKTKGLPPS